MMMNSNATAAGKGNSGRVVSIDILRGLAIFGMILCANIGWDSGLPAWMFHAQVPPPDYVFRPDVAGITWVDLVFPFFLFSMGAAFPFALHKRLSSGQPVGKVILGLAKRWAILAAFAVVLGNGYHARSSEANKFLVYLFLLLAWCGMFLSLARFRFKNEKMNHVANICGVVLIAGLGFMMQHVLGVPVSKSHSDIIIMVLAYVAFFGGLIWIFTRNSLTWRWIVFLFVGVIKGIASHVPEFFSFLPSPDSLGLGWIFSWKFLQYLMIAIAGSVVGDMILKQKDETADEPKSGKDVWLASLAIATVVFQLWGLFTRHVTADLVVSAISGIAFISLTFRNKALWSDIISMGYLLMIAGIVFDPVDGGITKDHCNLSYLLTTGGMAAITTGFLIFTEMRFGVRGRLLSECGQNPMIAYTFTNFVTNPVLYGVGLLTLIDKWAVGSPFMGIVRGLFVTGIMMAATIFFTRKKFFWRS